LNNISKQYTQVIIEGNAVANGESMESQNWHIANMLNAMSVFKVYVLGDKFEPPIDRVSHFKKDERNGSPFLTGFQADIVIRQNWPPAVYAAPVSYCGFGCRVTMILPWEFGALPEFWIKPLKDDIDYLWAPSRYNVEILRKSGLKEVGLLPAGIDCTALMKSIDHAKKPSSLDPPDDPDVVKFVFSGGFLPRKGVDIILTEWSTVFCDSESEIPFNDVKLVIHTNYEIGYSPSEVSEMENIISSCSNIEWKRNTWMTSSDHIALINNSDIYIAPFRSEGFGLPIVEAMWMGLSVITSVGGTAADDYIIEGTGGESSRLYPVKAESAVCDRFPCVESQLCIFPPCLENKGCTCKPLVNEPSWFEVNRIQLRQQMKKAYEDMKKFKHIETSKGMHNFKSNQFGKGPAVSFCWSSLQVKYRDQILGVINRPARRKISVSDLVEPEEELSNNEKITSQQSGTKFLEKTTAIILLTLGLLLIFLFKKIRLIFGRLPWCLLFKSRRAFRSNSKRPGVKNV